MKLTNKIPVDTRSSFFAITCICLITLALVFPASSIWAEDRPTIQVNFDFEGQLFDRIPAEDRAIIKARAEEKVCEIAEESWAGNRHGHPDLTVGFRLGPIHERQRFG